MRIVGVGVVVWQGWGGGGACDGLHLLGMQIREWWCVDGEQS